MPETTCSTWPFRSILVAVHRPGWSFSTSSVPQHPKKAFSGEFRLDRAKKQPRICRVSDFRRGRRPLTPRKSSPYVRSPRSKHRGRREVAGVLACFASVLVVFGPLMACEPWGAWPDSRTARRAILRAAAAWVVGSAFGIMAEPATLRCCRSTVVDMSYMTPRLNCASACPCSAAGE